MWLVVAQRRLPPCRGPDMACSGSLASVPEIAEALTIGGRAAPDIPQRSLSAWYNRPLLHAPAQDICTRGRSPAGFAITLLFLVLVETGGVPAARVALGVCRAELVSWPAGARAAS